MDFFNEKRSISYLSSVSGGIYIHVPFCRKKCIYCDFYSVGDRIAPWSDFVDALIAELHARSGEIPGTVHTVYIGGGTPSLMPPSEFLRLITALKPFMASVREFTLEVNPDDVNAGILETWKRGGVSRISMGIQSFDDSILSLLGRRHSAAGARRAFAMAHEFFPNVSVDLIYGLPGQSVEMWKTDLDMAVAMRPEHISAYSLMYESGTALTLLRDRGDLQESPESLTEEMFGMLVDTLRDAGYEHYEISNFALPGFRSIHNSSYWRQIPYIGLGPSAHSYDGNKMRSAGRADVRAYIAYWKGGMLEAGPDCNMLEREYLSEEELMEEYIMTALRTCEGISIEGFTRSFGSEACRQMLVKGRRWIEDGALVLHDGHLALAENALLISDAVILDLV